MGSCALHAASPVEERWARTDRRSSRVFVRQHHSLFIALLLASHLYVLQLRFHIPRRDFVMLLFIFFFPPAMPQQKELAISICASWKVLQEAKAMQSSGIRVCGNNVVQSDNEIRNER